MDLNTLAKTYLAKILHLGANTPKIYKKYNGTRALGVC
jgi:hypothetical protein